MCILPIRASYILDVQLNKSPPAEQAVTGSLAGDHTRYRVPDARKTMVPSFALSWS